MLEWIRVVYSAIAVPLHLPYIPFFFFSQGISTLLVSHLGLFVTLVFIRGVAFMTPRITLHDNGLLMQSALGRRFIPYTALRGIRSVELQPNGRYVVWVHSTKGLPLQNWLASLLFGRLVWSGFLMTSDLVGFDQVVAGLVTELKARYGEEGFAAKFSEESPTWLLRMLNAPVATVHELATAEEIQITPQDAAREMASVAASLAVPSAVGALVHLQVPWNVLVVPVLALLEWPLAGLYLTAVPIGELHTMSVQAAMRIYPITQLPRWVSAIALTLLVAAGAPIFILLPAMLIAVGLGTVTVLRLTEEWFAVKFPESLLGVVVTVVYQLVFFEIFLVLVTR